MPRFITSATFTVIAFGGLFLSGLAAPVVAADPDLPTAYRQMQEALDAYQAAVLDQARDPRDVAARRDRYLEAKRLFEQIKGNASAVAPTAASSSPAGSGNRVLPAVRVAAPATPRVTTAQAVERVLQKVRSGAKVTERDLDLSFAETNDNSLELQTGETFWQSLTRDIKAAKKSITIQMFGMEGDKTGWEFARLLAAKAKEGVEVILVADRSGARMMGLKNLVSTTEEEKLFQFYKDHGVKVVFYDRVSRGTSLGQKIDFFHFDHRKTFVIDGQVGYVGGYTLQQPSRETKHDMMVKCQGSVVHQMQSGLLLSFLYNGGKLDAVDEATLRAKFFPPPQNKGRTNARLAYNIPRGVHDVHDTYLQAIDQAKKYLYVINPYITNNDMVDRLCAAARRGVDVRLVHPGKAENPLNDANTRFHFEKMQKAGVKIYLYQGERGLGKLHAKGLIADDTFASIGSCNMDTMALRHNYEANILSKDPDFVRKVRADLFERDFQVSTLYEPPSSWWERAKIKIKGGLSELLDRWD
ncbi:MAG: Cardiolipin synthetase [Candidatus Ozemobacter sibiricus]|jgi:cardiolipin synthase|uniref:Cardiolipin synthetase n=1 Tax=Candidatus Ozemobacter sibiricus TaxID=2268124 RepID=A0A367ZKU3_9BACT|nr:MAG: Cardiolipin synthetase [Candidatus Ozemobacter sibiricus]